MYRFSCSNPRLILSKTYKKHQNVKRFYRKPFQDIWPKALAKEVWMLMFGICDTLVFMVSDYCWNAWRHHAWLWPFWAFEMRRLESNLWHSKWIRRLKMDVDCELDGDLLTKFSCLGTTDHDVLISELQKLLDFQLNPTGCAFFLDMTNW